MFSLDNHDMEHQRLIRQGQYQPTPVTALPATGNFGGQRLTLNKIDYEWDSTVLKWLSVQKFNLPLSTRDTQAYTQATHFWGGEFEDYDIAGIYLLNLRAGMFPNTIQSGVNFYTVSIILAGIAGAATTLTGLTGLTDTKTFTTASRWWPMKTIVNQAIGVTQFHVEAQMAPTAAPGTFFYYANLSYRLIGV